METFQVAGFSDFRLEAIALRLEAIPIRLEAPTRMFEDGKVQRFQFEVTSPETVLVGIVVHSVIDCFPGTACGTAIFAYIRVLWRVLGLG